MPFLVKQTVDSIQREMNKMKNEKLMLECSILQKQQLLKVNETNFALFVIDD